MFHRTVTRADDRQLDGRPRAVDTPGWLTRADQRVRLGSLLADPHADLFDGDRERLFERVRVELGLD